MWEMIQKSWTTPRQGSLAEDYNYVQVSSYWMLIISVANLYGTNQVTNWVSCQYCGQRRTALTPFKVMYGIIFHRVVFRPSLHWANIVFYVSTGSSVCVCSFVWWSVTHRYRAVTSGCLIALPQRCVWAMSWRSLADKFCFDTATMYMQCLYCY